MVGFIGRNGQESIVLQNFRPMRKKKKHKKKNIKIILIEFKYILHE